MGRRKISVSFFEEHLFIGEAYVHTSPENMVQAGGGIDFPADARILCQRKAEDEMVFSF